MTEPRLLTEAEAARYLSIPAAEVARLTFGRVKLGGKVRYDRRALDAGLDALSGLAAPSRPPADTLDESPDAAFDRFAERYAHAPGRS